MGWIALAQINKHNYKTAYCMYMQFNVLLHLQSEKEVG